jgi:hypothetical protein
VTATPTEIVLFSRPGCHLCEDAHALVGAILTDRAARGLPAPEIVERDIELDDELLRRYLLVIPVLAVGARELELATKPSSVLRFLAEVLDGATADPVTA